ncbi:taurine ABC transporter ATP-binding protein [Acidihalobacter prosperus]|uniref:Taurine transport ATP-binding protein TauB n=1 Tax=Acidihalobacter prosperus TaxID=160660 RepID=A0A1A6C3L4_9GAMM|nr:ATP-binding cassette domain-containing protein [Acidihalobacter prosperus]OBS09135.1 Taurine transport ATP-binding protein TauB [Acidihalobacter prosperus]
MLEIDQLSIEYGAKDTQPTIALQNVNLSVQSNEFIVVLGASGCGKTTLLNAIAGFIAPTRGEIRVNGMPVTGPGKDRGVVFQKHALMPWMSVIENVEFGLLLQGLPLHERRPIAMENLRRVGLSKSASTPVYELSGGMQQRVGLARAITASPDVMLLDEPLGALDAFTRESIQGLLLELWHETQRTFFFITHDVEEALFLATKLIVMAPSPGRISHEYSPEFSRKFMGSKDARQIKSASDFIEMREHVLSVVRDVSSGGH